MACNGVCCICDVGCSVVFHGGEDRCDEEAWVTRSEVIMPGEGIMATSALADQVLTVSVRRVYPV